MSARIAVIDLETDPFLHGRIPQAFAAGYYDGREFKHWWGDECVKNLVEFLHTQPKTVIYAHNGGRFDFFYLLEYLDNPLKVIASRIVAARLGKHELRDSFAILPVPLASYEKTSIDYTRFERDVREIHKREIVDYLRDDCVYLFDLVTEFRRDLGTKYTIASTAIRELSNRHSFHKGDQHHDERFRPFYYGGRVEAFIRGSRMGSFKILDVNSMYPYAMSAYDHPGSLDYEIRDEIDVDDCRFMFAEIRARSDGAFPVRTKRGLVYPRELLSYFATAHEIRAAIKTKKVTDIECVKAYYCEKVIRFDGFVSEFIAQKLAAEKAGDKARRLFAKLLLNSAYGKFAQNPEAYRDYILRRPNEPLPKNAELSSDFGFIEVWERPSETPGGFYDVAVAASITGASRAILLEAMSSAKGVIYCDTDSLICEDFGGKIHASELGAWKLEAEADLVAIAGKKLYACKKDGEFVKWASKGVRLEPQKIVDIANGGIVDSFADAPTFTLKGGKKFQKRKVRMT